jgi:hypothetical protein
MKVDSQIKQKSDGAPVDYWGRGLVLGLSSFRLLVAADAKAGLISDNKPVGASFPFEGPRGWGNLMSIGGGTVDKGKGMFVHQFVQFFVHSLKPV